VPLTSGPKQNPYHAIFQHESQTFSGVASQIRLVSISAVGHEPPPAPQNCGQPNVMGASRAGRIPLLHAANNVRRYLKFQSRAGAVLEDRVGRLVMKRDLPIYLPGLRLVAPVIEYDGNF
jgi:hypothetical protein